MCVLGCVDVREYVTVRNYSVILFKEFKQLVCVCVRVCVVIKYDGST